MHTCIHRSDRLLEHCSIALVGKYTKFSDSYASVIKALEHSALAISHKLEVKVCAQLLSHTPHYHILLCLYLFFTPRNMSCSSTHTIDVHTVEWYPEEV